MTKFTLLKGSFLLFLLAATLSNKVYAQSGSASSATITNGSASTVTLTGTPPGNRRFISSTSWAFLSGPQSISVGSTSFSPNQTSNNNTVTAAASFPSATTPGTYTFKLSYTVTTNSGGTTSTTGSLNVTVIVSVPAPANPAAGNSNNCTTNAAITTCPAGSSGVQTGFSNGVYNRGNDANHLGAGAIWRFTNIATVSGNQVNAEIRVDAISNATLANSGSGSNTSATAKIEDDAALNQSNVSIASYFSPRIAPNVSGNGNARGYIQFTIFFFKNVSGGFTSVQNLTNLNFVHLDIDGSGNSSAWFRETGLALSYGGSSPTVIANAGTELVTYSYTDNSTTPGGDWNGYAGSVFERDGVSTCAQIAVAYRYAQARSSVTFRMGYDYKGTGNPGTGARQYGATFGCFNFPNEISLPVKLISFSGNLENNISKLRWETSMEENFSGYVIQRSYNGSDFSDISVTPAAGHAHVYNFNDDAADKNADKLYYRLKMVDIDNSFTYSGVVLLKKSLAGGNITIMPNPFSKEVRFSINSLSTENITYTLLNSDGRQLRKVEQKLNRGNNVFYINDLGSLQTGVYFLQIQCNDDFKTIKLLKNQ